MDSLVKELNLGHIFVLVSMIFQAGVFWATFRQLKVTIENHVRNTEEKFNQTRDETRKIVEVFQIQFKEMLESAARNTSGITTLSARMQDLHQQVAGQAARCSSLEDRLQSAYERIAHMQGYIGARAGRRDATEDPVGQAEPSKGEG